MSSTINLTIPASSRSEHEETALPLQVSGEVGDYCERTGLSDHLPMIMVLLDRLLPVSGTIVPEVRHDHEGAEQWLTLVVPVSGEFEAIMRGHDELLTDLGESVPWTAAEAIHVSLIPG